MGDDNQQNTMMIISIHSFIPLLNSIFSSTFQLWNDENNIKLTTTFTIFIIFPPFFKHWILMFSQMKWTEQWFIQFNYHKTQLMILEHWDWRIEWIWRERETNELMGTWSDWSAELWLLFCDSQPLWMKWTTTWKG